MAVELVTGPAATVACDLLALLTALYGLATATHSWTGFRRGYQDRWSSLSATSCLFALAWGLHAWGPRELPSPFAPALLGILVACALLAPIFMAFGLQGLLDRIATRMPKWMRWRMPDMSHEDRRKGPHLLMGLFMLYFPLGPTFMAALGILGPDAAVGEGWGNVLTLRDGPWVAAGQVAALTILLALVFVLLPVELLRLRFPAHDYPFRRIIEPRLREREHGLFGAHLYIALGVALAVLALGQDPDAWDMTVPAAMAVVAVTVFADTASALVGIRWGRRRWFHNAGKSYIGTAGGAAVALLCCLPLVGVGPAFAATLLFVAVDAVAPWPLPVSDNFLNPLGLATLFWFGRAHLQAVWG